MKYVLVLQWAASEPPEYHECRSFDELFDLYHDTLRASLPPHRCRMVLHGGKDGFGSLLERNDEPQGC